MKVKVEMLAFGEDGEFRDVLVPEPKSSDTVVDVLENVFQYGQNEVQPQPHPSVSVGDVVHYQDYFYRVDNFGFQKLDADDLKEYRNVDSRDRSFWKPSEETA